MQVNNIRTTNFGASPTSLTRHFLHGMEQKGVDTMPIMLKMRSIFTSEKVDMWRFSDGTFAMDMYLGGTHTRKLMKPNDSLHLDINYYPIEAKKIAEKLMQRLDELDKKRGSRQRILDKIGEIFPL